MLERKTVPSRDLVMVERFFVHRNTPTLHLKRKKY